MEEIKKELLELGKVFTEMYFADKISYDDFDMIFAKLGKALTFCAVNSTLQVLEIEEQLTKVTNEIHILEDSYINADELGDMSAKKHIGKELKRLRKERENL